MPSPRHRIVGLVECNALFTAGDAAAKEQQEAVLAEFASLGSGLPILGPAGFGKFKTSTQLIRRNAPRGAASDPFLNRVLELAFRRHRTTGAVLLLDVQHSPPRGQAKHSDERAFSVSAAASMVLDTLRGLVHAANIARPGSLDSVNLGLWSTHQSRCTTRRRSSATWALPALTRLGQGGRCCAT